MLDSLSVLEIVENPDFPWIFQDLKLLCISVGLGGNIFERDFVTKCHIFVDTMRGEKYEFENVHESTRGRPAQRLLTNY